MPLICVGFRSSYRLPGCNHNLVIVEGVGNSNTHCSQEVIKLHSSVEVLTEGIVNNEQQYMMFTQGF